jgi:hypothetical protein
MIGARPLWSLGSLPIVRLAVSVQSVHQMLPRWSASTVQELGPLLHGLVQFINIHHCLHDPSGV